MDSKRKKEFTPCKMGVISFEQEDVITASPTSSIGDGFEGEEQPFGFGDTNS